VAKGNPKVAGVRGIILYPKGNQETSFAWGIGIVINNVAKILMLFQGHPSKNVKGLKNFT
jgi:hypothetical protein